MKIICGQPHASTFLYIKTSEAWAPEDALNFFGISKYARDQSFDSISDRFWFYDDGKWLHILDGWDYTLYFLTDRESKLIELSNRFEIVWFCVSDSDLSFDYAIYQRGKCVRKLVVESPLYNDQVVKINVGSVQEFERDFINESGEILVKDPDRYTGVFLNMVNKFGIMPNYNEGNLQVYRHGKFA